MARGRALDDVNDYIQTLKPLGVTPQEARVAHRIAWPHKNSEIAEILGIAVSTVKSHVHSLFSKLGVHNREDLGVRVRIEVEKWRRGPGRGGPTTGRP